MNKNYLLYKETERIKVLMSEQIFLGGPTIGFSPKNAVKTIDWMKTWNKHDWLSFIEVTSGILGMVPTPATPILMFISTAAAVSNATGYWKEGHHFEAGLILSFSLLSTGVLINLLKNSEIFMKLGAKGSTELIENVASGTASRAEQEMAKKLVKEITPVADKLAKETSKEIVKRFIAELPKKSLIELIKILRGISKLGIYGIKEGVVIAGTFITYDKMYRALNYKNEKNLSERDKNQLVNLYQLIFNNQDEIQQSMLREVKKAQPKLFENPDTIIHNDTTFKITF